MEGASPIDLCPLNSSIFRRVALLAQNFSPFFSQTQEPLNGLNSGRRPAGADNERPQVSFWEEIIQKRCNSTRQRRRAKALILQARKTSTSKKNRQNIPDGDSLPRPQGSVLPLHPVSGPCVWEAADYSDPASYATVLTEADVAELVSAIEAAEAKLKLGVGNDTKIDDTKIERAVASREDFPLPTLGPKLVALAEEAKNGRGFVLIQGFPVDKLTRQQAVIGYWGFGLYW